MTHSRRQFLGLLGKGALAAGVAAAVPSLIGASAGRALAAGTGTKRFLFVVNRGGWDPLTALAPMFDNRQVMMPVGSEAATIGGIPVVDHAMRPSVRAFFEAYASKTLVLHGVSVRSVSHEICETTMMTGAATGGAPDFATRLAVSAGGDALPHFVISGPTYPGSLAALVARGGQTGQLQELVTGDIMARSDVPVSALSRPSARLIDDFVRRRTDAFAAAAPTERRSALVTALERATRLEDLQWDMSFGSDGSFASQLEIAVEALSRGIAHCVTVSPPVSWDTHTDSDNQQSQLWELLFAGLVRAFGRMASAPSPLAGAGVGASRKLLDDVVVVVISEMGRTPQLNADQGRDHWPWTSALIMGDGVTGGRVVGGFDSGYAGRGIDPESGDIDEASPAPSPAALGATLLELAGLDPMVMGPGVTPLSGILT